MSKYNWFLVNNELGFVSKAVHCGEWVHFHSVFNPESHSEVPCHQVKPLNRLLTDLEKQALDALGEKQLWANSDDIKQLKGEVVYSSDFGEVKESLLSYIIRNVRSAIGLLVGSLFVILVVSFFGYIFPWKKFLAVAGVIIGMLFAGWCLMGFIRNGFSKRKTYYLKERE